MALILGILHEHAVRRSTRPVEPVALQTISVANIKEAAALNQVGELRILGRQGHWYSVRPSGRLKTWKRDPGRVELPVKYGLYESLTLTSHDFNGGRVAVRAS